ncbi:MAG: hypothetical protein GX267_04540 [Fibrobacter sp.]|jgi:hypothetical protein|nr:hypothetical protein [Fibrobacter sp.]
MKKTITSFSLLVLCVSTSGFDMDNASAVFISHLKKADSISEFLSQGTLFENRSKTAIDSLLRDILYNNPQLYGILRVCQDGKVLNDINRGTNSNATLNVKNRPWFQTSIEKGSSYTGEVFTVNSNVCFLKSYPLTLNTSAAGVIAVLIDLKYCLGELAEKSLSPFILFYDKAIVYQSDPPLQVSKVSVPDFGKLELIYSNNSPESFVGFPTQNQKTGKDFSVFNQNNFPTTFLPWTIALLTVGISLLIIYLSKPRIKKEELIALEYQKLPEETHKMIRDRAISQLYCEIKRQIETHEMDKIQQEVREKLALAYESSLVNNKKVLVE